MQTPPDRLPADSVLVFHYHRLNTYSFNALAAALDAAPELSEMEIRLPRTRERLLQITEEELEHGRRVILAFSVMTCQYPETAAMISDLRVRRGGSARGGGSARIAILAGGPHATACPEDLADAGADIIFRGEAEQTFPMAVRRLLRGDPCAPILKPGAPVDLDDFHSISPSRGMFGPIEITRGCAFACRYCQTSQIFGTELRHRSLDCIVRQAEALQSINRKVVRLLSPNAFSYGSPDGRRLNLDAVSGLLAALRETVSKEGKIFFAHFPSEARPEHVTEDTLGLLKRFADNDEIVIGAQSGSQRMLDACHRAHSVGDVFQAVALARKNGFKVIVDFIFGLPGEGERDREESLKTMERIVDLGARVHPHLFAPLPQTAFSGAPAGTPDPFYRKTVDALRTRQGLYETRVRRPQA